MRSRIILLALLAAVVLAATAGTWFIARDSELTALRKRADDGLSLKRNNVVTEAGRYGHLPFVVAQDAQIRRLLDRPRDPWSVEDANRYLEAVNHRGGSHDLFVMDATGLTLASSNWRDPDSRVGRRYGFRPYFQDAIKSGEGHYYAIGATGGVAGYYLSHLIARAVGEIGVAVVKVDLSPLEGIWENAGESVGLVDRAGMIFLSSEPDWRFVPLHPLSAEDRDRLRRQYRPYLFDRPPLQPRRDLRAGEDFYLSLRGHTLFARLVDIPEHDWRILAAYDVAPIYAIANRDAAIVFLALVLLATSGFYLNEHRERLHANRLRAILEDMSLGISVFDADLRLVAWNGPYVRVNGYPAALIRAGRPLTEIIRHNVERGDFGPGNPERQLQERIERARQPAAGQVEVRRPDDTWVEIRHSRTPTGWVVRTYSDITERKRTEIELDAHRNHLERLVEQRTGELVQVNGRLQEAVAQTDAAKRHAEEANQAKTRFLKDVTHDIRSPIATILKYAELVMASAKESLPIKQYHNLEKLAARGRELDELVVDLLDYTRADQIRIAAFRLEPIIEECQSLIDPDRLKAGRIAFVPDIPEDLPELVQDGRKLRRIVNNLVVNADRFTEAGTIGVSAARRGDTIEIAVADTGIGIAAADIERIFDEGVQLKPGAGAGLGLAICRRFARLMGGEVTVRSRLGEGSVFTVTIPIIHPRAAANGAAARGGPLPATDPPVAAAATASDTTGGQATVLVVDDSRANRDVLVQMLEPHYRVLVAADGKQAIEMTRLERPDLILMDLALPRVDGWEATRTIKRDPALRPIPIIAVTSHVATQDREAFAAAGGDGFLAKPVDEKALFESLRHHLGGRRGRDS